MLRNIGFWKMFVWKSGRQQGQEAAVQFFVKDCLWEKKHTQTTDGHIVAVSFILGPPGLQTHVFFPAKFWKLQSVCAHVIPTWARFHNVSQSYIEFQLFVISHANIWSSQPLFFPVGRFSSLGWGFGTFLVFDCRCLQRGAEDEKIQWNSCASCRSSTNMKKCFQHSKSNLGWILRCPHPGSWVLGPKSWSPAGNTEVHGALLVFHGNPGKTIFPKYVCFFGFRPLFWFMLFLFPFFLFVYCGIPVFMCFSLWDSVCFHISPLEFMIHVSTFFLFIFLCLWIMHS